MSKQRTAIRRPDYVMALLGKAMTFMHQKDVPLLDTRSNAASRPGAYQDAIVPSDRGKKESGSRIDKVRDACAPAINDFFMANPSVEVLSMSALDGFEVISLARDPAFNPARFSVISNALATIGRAVTTEFKMGDTEFNLINATHGRIVTMHLSGRGVGFTLAVMATNEATLGGLLVGLKNICQNITIILDGSQ